jgi:hypothetical protein
MGSSYGRRGYFEINADPDRLDMSSHNVREVAKASIKVAVGADPIVRPDWTICAAASMSRGERACKNPTYSTQHRWRNLCGSSADEWL